MFKTGYILNPKHDLVWFLGLPFFAVAMALGFQAWLPYVAVASINLWITIPHHYAGWVRSYGMPDVWEQAQGLDPDDPSDGPRDVGDGTTYLERYLNGTRIALPAAPVLLR